VIEVSGDIWSHPARWKVITTNGSVRKDGLAVMGRGVAFQAKSRYPNLPLALGRAIQLYGNIVQIFPAWYVIALPVKHAWHQRADIELIERGCRELATNLDATTTAAMVRPGCGNGQLQWEQVKPVIEPLLDDRFFIVEWS